MNPAELLPKSADDRFLNFASEERWAHLKPVIVSLYTEYVDSNGKRMTYSKVAGFMKTNYNFYAAESQYKRWFAEWGVRKRTVACEKDGIVRALGKRKRSEQSTSNVFVQQGESSKRVDKKQLVRYLKGEIRDHQNVQMAPGVKVETSFDPSFH